MLLLLRSSELFKTILDFHGIRKCYERIVEECMEVC